MRVPKRRIIIGDLLIAKSLIQQTTRRKYQEFGPLFEDLLASHTNQLPNLKVQNIASKFLNAKPASTTFASANIRILQTKPIIAAKRTTKRAKSGATNHPKNSNAEPPAKVSQIYRKRHQTNKKTWLQARSCYRTSSSLILSDLSTMMHTGWNSSESTPALATTASRICIAQHNGVGNTVVGVTVV